jgi:hypothetical protein
MHRRNQSKVTSLKKSLKKFPEFITINIGFWAEKPLRSHKNGSVEFLNENEE